AAVGGEPDERVAGDAGQDRAGQRRRDHRVVVHHEEDVHAAELIHVTSLHGVEEDDLVAAVADGLGLGDQAGGVVAAALGGAGAAGRGAGVVVGDPQRDRLHAALEVRAGGRGDDDVGVFGRRLDAEEDLGGIHEGAQVEAGAVLAGDP